MNPNENSSIGVGEEWCWSEHSHIIIVKIGTHCLLNLTIHQAECNWCNKDACLWLVSRQTFHACSGNEMENALMRYSSISVYKIYLWSLFTEMLLNHPISKQKKKKIKLLTVDGDVLWYLPVARTSLHLIRLPEAVDPLPYVCIGRLIWHSVRHTYIRYIFCDIDTSLSANNIDVRRNPMLIAMKMIADIENEHEAIIRVVE